MTSTPTSSYAINTEIVGTVVEHTAADGASGPCGWMVRRVCGYEAGPYAAGLVHVANNIRDQHEKTCMWPRT